jgi:AraC family transcriptional regulator
MTPEATAMPATTSTRLTEFSGARALVKHYAPDLTLERHSHSYAALVLVLDGGFRETCGGGDDVRVPGALRTLPIEAPHANRYGASGARCFLVEIPEPVEERWTGTGGTLLRLGHHAVGTRPAILAGEMYRELCVSDHVSPLALHGLALELLAALGRAPRLTTRPPAWLTLARERLQDEFRDPLDLEGLARDAGVHPTHFTRAFRRHFACSPTEYVVRLRMEWAKAALLTSDVSLAAIALEAGYSDQASFTKRFRAVVGCTPGVFRAGGRRSRGGERLILARRVRSALISLEGKPFPRGQTVASCRVLQRCSPGGLIPAKSWPT